MPFKPHYWFSDGLAEIGVGVGFMVTGGVLLLIGFLPTLTLKMMAMPAAGLFISWAFPSVITAVRTRWLTTAAGMAIHRTTLRAQVSGAAVILPIVVWLSLNFATLAQQVTAADSWRLWCITIGLFFSLIPLFLGFVSGVIRFYLMAAPIIGAGFLSIFMAPNVTASALIVWFVTGLCFCLSGLITLLRFRVAQKHTQKK